MIEGNDIICFCNDWDGDPLSKKQIVTRLAKRNRILWVNSTGNRNPTASVHDMRRAWKKVRQFCRGCRPVAANISVFSPLVIPFHGNRFARWINQRIFAFSLRRACRKLGFRNPITLTFVPSSADVVGSLGERQVIYYCVDEYSEFSGTNAEAILQMERRLIQRSDLVIVSASRLLERKLPDNPNTFLITHGVDAAHFRLACSPATAIPDDFPKVEGPVIGFFGLIEDWVDLALIRQLALARPAWHFVFVGEQRADTSALRGIRNVHLLGRRPYQSLPAYCKAFDVAILPFVINDLTMAANPLKLREYLAAGLPVVSSPLPEVRKLGNLVHLAHTPQEYLAHIDGLLAAAVRGPSLARSLRMDAESWDAKVEELSAHIVRCEAGLPVHAPSAAVRSQVA
jgi:glycosyltransferase involved in cell wall biosynthesis